MSHDDDQEPAEPARGGTLRGPDPGTCSGCGGPAHRIWAGETPHWWHTGDPCHRPGARFVPAARQTPEPPRDRQHPRAPRDRQQPPGRDR